MPKLIVSAFGVHTGGSYVLLEALLRGAGSRLKRAYVDTRAFERLSAFVPQNYMVAVRPTANARILTLWRIAKYARKEDCLLCFNSIPPLLRSAAKTIVYVHTPHMVDGGGAFKYTWKERARMRIERALFHLSRLNSDQFWVQTPTVATAIKSRYPELTVDVVPFVDCAIFLPPAPAVEARHSSVTLIYPADGIAHKNHVNLFRAWGLLAAEGQRPQLQLTLKPDEFARRMMEAGLDRVAMAHISSERFPSRDQVLDHIREADAIIFPSRAETFGIPFLEATAYGKPILASENDFVRDVCVPVETFNPSSARSIADAVLRFIGTPRSIVRPIYPEAFVERLLDI